MNESVNPVGTGLAVLSVSSETAGNEREPPPAYSETSDDPTVTSQPIVHQTIIVQSPLKNGPIYYNCPHCHDRVLTKVIYKNTHKTHVLAGFICGCTCWCLLCCLAGIPYLISTFKNCEHYCPNCNTLLGTYSKI